MRIFVVGATGTLGRPTVRALRAAGHDVRALARSASSAASVRELGAEPVVGDLLDAVTVSRAAVGSDAVLHLATRIPPLARMRSRTVWDENDRIRRDGARILVDAAIAAGAPIYVQQSVALLYADGGDRWLDETTPIDARWPLASAADAERETARFASRGGAGVALRIGSFYAPYAPSTRDTVALARRRLLVIPGSGDHYMSPIHVDDAATAVVAALAVPTGVYNVCDDEPLPMRDYVRALTGAFGLPAALRVPAFVGRFVMGAVAPILLRSQRVANGRFKDAAGWTPRHRNAREGWMAVARALA